MSPEVYSGLILALVTLCIFAPVGFYAYVGWMYGNSEDASPLGFIFRIIAVGTIGSWCISMSVGHGVGFAPIPSFICGYYSLKYGWQSCYPWAWVTPLVSVMVYLFCALAGARRLSRKNPKWSY